jgi:hypothetical protein
MITKKDLSKKLYEELGERSENVGFDQFHKSVWKSLRNKKVGGWGLTFDGYKYLRDVLGYKDYRIEFPKDEEFQVTSQTVIWMDRFIDCPYFLDKDAIIVFKEKTAFQLILFSGDVHKFGWSSNEAKHLL